MAVMHTIKRTYQDRIFDTVNYLFLSLFTLITVFPFYNSIVLSFNEGKDAVKGGIYFFPRVFTLENYRNVFANPDFINAAFITASRTVVGTLASLFFTAAFGYVISKEYLCFRKIYITIGIITMYFNGGLIPTYIMIRNLGLVNNFLVFILPLMFSMINALVFMTFFKAIPVSLEESARIDGANDLLIFIKVVIPVSGPVLASIALLNAVIQWNSWYDAMLYTNIPQLDTLANMFQKMLTAKAYLENESKFVAGNAATTTTTSLHLAAMVVTVAPVITIYPFFQKYFAKGIMLGSVKG